MKREQKWQCMPLGSYSLNISLRTLNGHKQLEVVRKTHMKECQLSQVPTSLFWVFFGADRFCTDQGISEDFECFWIIAPSLPCAHAGGNHPGQQYASRVRIRTFQTVDCPSSTKDSGIS